MKRVSFTHILGVLVVIAVLFAIPNTTASAKGGPCKNANSANCKQNEDPAPANNGNGNGNSSGNGNGNNNGNGSSSTQGQNNPSTPAQNNDNNSGRSNTTNNTRTETTNENGETVVTIEHETLNISEDGDPMVFKYSSIVKVFTEDGPVITRTYFRFIVNANGDLVSEKSYTKTTPTLD